MPCKNCNCKECNPIVCEKCKNDNISTYFVKIETKSIVPSVLLFIMSCKDLPYEI